MIHDGDAHRVTFTLLPILKILERICDLCPASEESEAEDQHHDVSAGPDIASKCLVDSMDENAPEGGEWVQEPEDADPGKNPLVQGSLRRIRVLILLIHVEQYRCEKGKEERE